MGFSCVMDDLSPMSVYKDDTTAIDLIDELIGNYLTHYRFSAPLCL